MTKPKAKRRNWSKSPDLEIMKEAVEAFDLYRLENPKENILVTDYWKINLEGKIPFNTFRTYTYGDASKRTLVGTQVGPRDKLAKLIERERKKKAKLEKAKQIQELAALGSYYRWLAGMRQNLSQAQIDNQQESRFLQQQEKLSRDQRLYQRLSLNKHIPRTPAEKKQQFERCKRVLPRQCATILANGAFLEEELGLLMRCYSTFGFAQVPYMGPTIDETIGTVDSKAKTVKRRSRMEAKLRLFKLIQVRRSLSMLNSGAGRPALMVTLDVLLKKYDEELDQLGLEPSGLRGQLREANDNRRNDLKEMRRQAKWAARTIIEDEIEEGSEDEDSTVASVDDLGISIEQRNASCQQIRAEMGEEEAVLADGEFNLKGLHHIQVKMDPEEADPADDVSEEEIGSEEEDNAWACKILQCIRVDKQREEDDWANVESDSDGDVKGKMNEEDDADSSINEVQLEMSKEDAKFADTELDGDVEGHVGMGEDAGSSTNEVQSEISQEDMDLAGSELVENSENKMDTEEVEADSTDEDCTLASLGGKCSA